MNILCVLHDQTHNIAINANHYTNEDKQVDDDLTRCRGIANNWSVVYITTRNFITPANDVGRRFCIHPCLFVCMCVCSQDYSNSYRRIWMKLYGEVGDPGTMPLNFVGDPDC